MHSMHPLLADVALAQMQEQHAYAARWQNIAVTRLAQPKSNKQSRFQSVLSFLLTL